VLLVDHQVIQADANENAEGNLWTLVRGLALVLGNPAIPMSCQCPCLHVWGAAVHLQVLFLNIEGSEAAAPPRDTHPRRRGPKASASEEKEGDAGLAKMQAAAAETGAAAVRAVAVSAPGQAVPKGVTVANAQPDVCGAALASCTGSGKEAAAAVAARTLLPEQQPPLRVPPDDASAAGLAATARAPDVAALPPASGSPFGEDRSGFAHLHAIASTLSTCFDKVIQEKGR